MVYIDKKGKRYEVQYSVVLKQEKYEIRQYFWTSEEKINYIFKSCSFDGKKDGIKHIINMKHIVFTGNPGDVKKSKKSAKAEFVSGRLDSLEFHVDTEEDLSKCLEYFKLG